MRIVFATPGGIEARTGGQGYCRRVMEALPSFNIDVALVALRGRFPFPSVDEAMEAARAINAAARPRDIALIDSAAFGAMDEEAIRLIKAPVVALCHRPLWLEPGLGVAEAAALLAREKTALAMAAHVIVTSRQSRIALTESMGAPASSIAVAPPGADPAQRAQGSERGTALLAVGAIIPRKGFDILVEALAGLRDIHWRLRLVGAAACSPETAAVLARQIEARGLGARIDWLGELDAQQLDRIYDASDIFVSPSLCGGCGMGLAEALSRGLPVIATIGRAGAGALPVDAGLNIPPGDVGAIRDALKRVMLDSALRGKLADGAWRAAGDLPTWTDTARIISRVARAVAPVAA